MGAVRIQVAFQGGGAKLVCLLAVAEAFQQAEEDGLVQITRLSGTSAGSIVAALMAAERPVAEVRRLLAATGSDRLGRILPKRSLGRHLFKLLRSRPLYEEKELKAWLGELFPETDLLENLKRDLFVVATSLTAKDRQITFSNTKNPQEYLTSVLASSCALPFVFRTGLQGDSRIDGGLCENLPVDSLRLEEPEYGPVLGISFERRQSDSPSNLIDFGKAFWASAIEANVDRSIRLLPGDRVYPIQTEIGTFDFVEAMSFLGSDGYRLVRRQAADWIRKATQRLGLGIDEQPDKDSSTRFVDFWRDDNKASRDLMQLADKVYRKQHTETSVQLDCSTLVVTAFSLVDSRSKDYGRPDEVRQIVKLRPMPGKDLYCYRLRLAADTDDPNGTFLTEAELGVERSDVEEHDIVVVPVSDSTTELENLDPKSREVVVHFDPVIRGTENDRSLYTIWQLRLLQGGLSRLRDSGRDSLTNRNTRQVPIKRVEFILFVPSASAARLRAEAGGPIAILPIERERLADFRTFTPVGFEAIGWFCEAVPPGARGEVALTLE